MVGVSNRVHSTALHARRDAAHAAHTGRSGRQHAGASGLRRTYSSLLSSFSRLDCRALVEVPFGLPRGAMAARFGPRQSTRQSCCEHGGRGYRQALEE
jgi:hypothetical protein